MLLALAAAGGCSQPAPPPPPPPPPEVQVATPEVRQVSDYEEFTGRTEAENTVEIRARVTGYLKEIRFKDGDMVKEGDLLFEIDPRPYQADLAKNEAALAQAKARLARLELDYGRARNLVQTRAMSREDFDKTHGDRDEAQSAVESARAALESARLYLGWTRVCAPFSGRLSRRSLDKGNMVKADETTLTSIVSTDKMFVYFDMDERTLLRWRSEAPPLQSGQAGRSDVEMGLAFEEGYPHQGIIDFQDNRVDVSTGTLRMRGVFANPTTRSGKLLFSPGLFARVRLPIGRPKRAVLVADRALGTDQGRKFLYVVKDQTDPESGQVRQTVQRRYVHPGALHGGLREIKTEDQGKTLPPDQTVGGDEKVVVSGLQRVRPGAEVKPKDVAMPVYDPRQTPAAPGKVMVGAKR
jgi:RND family efflux transporter MFP subunit